MKFGNEYLCELLKNDYPDEYNEIIKGLSTKKTSFRVNLLKTTAEKIADSFKKQNINASLLSSFNDVFICENFAEEIKLTQTNEFKNGEIYLQNPSSCLPVVILSPSANEDVLDMAAAPGGKTTQIASITAGKSNITACERHPIRADKLKYNLQKQGVKNANVIVKDARELEDWFSFDKILLDAPCSGSGTLDLAKENNKFSQTLIEKCQKTQQALLSKAAKLLKKGGILVYSTCSLLKQENELAVKKLLKNGIFEVVPISENLLNSLPTLKTDIDGAVCVCPNDIYEGFFVVCLKKK